MIQKTYFCDHCQKEVPSSEYFDIAIKAKSGYYHGGEAKFTAGLCHTCLIDHYEELYAIIGEPEIETEYD